MIDHDRQHRIGQIESRRQVCIDTRITENVIVTISRCDRIVSAAPKQQIVAAAAADDIVTLAAEHGHAMYAVDVKRIVAGGIKRSRIFRSDSRNATVSNPVLESFTQENQRGICINLVFQVTVDTTRTDVESIVATATMNDSDCARRSTIHVDRIITNTKSDVDNLKILIIDSGWYDCIHTIARHDQRITAYVQPG